MPAIETNTAIRSDDQVFRALTATFQTDGDNADGDNADGLTWADSDGDETAPFGVRLYFTLASEGFSDQRIAEQATEWHATTGLDGMPLLDDARLAAALAAIGTPMSPASLAASKAQMEACIAEEFEALAKAYDEDVRHYREHMRHRIH